MKLSDVVRMVETSQHASSSYERHFARAILAMAPVVQEMVERGCRMIGEPRDCGRCLPCRARSLEADCGNTKGTEA